MRDDDRAADDPVRWEGVLDLPPVLDLNDPPPLPFDLYVLPEPPGGVAGHAVTGFSSQGPHDAVMIIYALFDDHGTQVGNVWIRQRQADGGDGVDPADDDLEGPSWIGIRGMTRIQVRVSGPSPRTDWEYGESLVPLSAPGPAGA